MKIVCALFSICAALCCSVTAQMLDGLTGGSEIQVRVNLPYSSQINGMAKVEVFRGETPFGSDTTNSRGEVTFRGLSRGTYVIRVTLPGYKPEEQTVEIATGSDSRQAYFYLQVDPSATQLDIGPSLDDPIVSVGVLATPEKAQKELNKARESRMRGDCKKAIEQARKTLEIVPDFVLGYHELGLCQYSLGKLDDAQKSFSTAIQKDPKFLYSYLSLARVLARKRDLQGATNVLAEASRQHPQRGEPYFEMAKLQLATNDPLRAEKTAEMALARDCSRIPEMPFLMASIYVKEGNKEKAISTLQDFVAKAKEGPEVDRAKFVIEELKAPDKVSGPKKR